MHITELLEKYRYSSMGNTIKIKKKAAIISFVCIIFFGVIIYNAIQIQQWIPYRVIINNHTDVVLHKQPMTSNNSSNLEEILERIIDGDRNIFFLETSHIKNKDEIIMNPRQGCAVESAARMNPTMWVYLFIFNAQRTLDYSNSTKNIVAQLEKYKNIVIRQISLETYLSNSPVQKLWNDTNGLSTSQWFTSHMSDILRYLTLWKFGGVYLDLDVVIKSSLENMYNFVGAESSSLLAAGAMGFDATKVGRRYANASLYELLKDFRGNEWVHNGPGVITRTLKKICGTESISNMTTERCDGFQVFPPPAFYPIHWGTWKKFFVSENKEATMKTIKKSLSIHVWNKLSQSTNITVGSDVPYAAVANQYCPMVYNNCGNTF